MNKKKVLKKLHPKIYQIYGIFDFSKEKLVYVNLDYDAVELEFELKNYSEDFDIICFKTMVN